MTTEQQGLPMLWDWGRDSDIEGDLHGPFEHDIQAIALQVIKDGEPTKTCVLLRSPLVTRHICTSHRLAIALWEPDLFNKLHPPQEVPNDPDA